MTKKGLIGRIFLVVLFWGTYFTHAQTPGQTLSELERTKLLLIREQQKNNVAQGQLIYTAHERNLADAQKLRDDETALLDSICTAHGLKPSKCSLSADAREVVSKDAAPAKAPPKPAATSGHNGSQ